MRCGSWPLIHSYAYPFSSQSFPRDFHCQEYTQFSDVNKSLFIRLHFTIGCYNRPWTSRCCYGFQVLFADHVHRRSGVYNKFSFLKFKGWWCRQAPIFGRWEECCFIFLLYISDMFGHLPRCLAGTSLLPFRLFLRPILKFWSIGAALMRITWANHSKWWVLVSNDSVTYHGSSESNTSDWFLYVWALPQNRWKSLKTSAAPYPGIRNPIVVYLMR